MGQCVSVVPATEVPRCRLCKREGPAPWGKLDLNQRSAWVWEGSEAFCKKCIATRKLDKLVYEKERQAYQKTKEVMYPKPNLKPELKRIKTGEKWDGETTKGSFYSGWMPSSALKRVLSAIQRAQQEDPSSMMGMQRKPTGFVPAATPSALDGQAGLGKLGPLNAVSEQEAGGAGAEGYERVAESGEAEAGEDYLAAHHRQLAALEEEHELEQVEEVSLCDGSEVSGAAGDGAILDTHGEISSSVQPTAA